MSVLPDTDFVARTCRASSLDPTTREPTPASFEFRLKNEEWTETYLSVNWMEFLPDGTGSHAEKLARLRAFLLEPPGGIPGLKPTKKMVFAVVPVASIHAAQLAEVGTTLCCKHVPWGDGDPHSGVFPSPGVECWPKNADAPAHLAVQQHLLVSMCHHEPALPLVE